MATTFEAVTARSRLPLMQAWVISSSPPSSPFAWTSTCKAVERAGEVATASAKARQACPVAEASGLTAPRRALAARSSPGAVMPAAIAPRVLRRMVRMAMKQISRCLMRGNGVPWSCKVPVENLRRVCRRLSGRGLAERPACFSSRRLAEHFHVAGDLAAILYL